MARPTVITTFSCYFLLTIIVTVAAASRSNYFGKKAGTYPLIVPDEENSRRHKAECIMGGVLHELGSTWFADLGAPFGVMYCIRCDCTPVQKKRRVIAKTDCRNIKNDCPEPKCNEPILYPGRCCKICPGDESGLDILPIHPSTFDEDEKNMKHFGAILSGRTTIRKGEDLNLLGGIKDGIAATGRLTFSRKNLYYSFILSEGSPLPQIIQFTNNEGSIIEEHPVTDRQYSSYRNATGKICGVWRRIPREYRRLLRENRMFVSLAWMPTPDSLNMAITGLVARLPALTTEQHSALLEPSSNGKVPPEIKGTAGTAIIATSITPTPSVHVTVVFNGIFPDYSCVDVPVNISLIMNGEKQEVVLQEMQRIIPNPDKNIMELSSPVTAADLRHLTRGKLIVSISHRDYPSLRISGTILPRITCELFQAQLLPIQPTRQPVITGIAWAYLTRDGALAYYIQVDKDRIPDNVSQITLGHINGKHWTDLDDLTLYYNHGWVNGTLDRLGPRLLEPLYNGELAVRIVSPQPDTTVRGKLIVKQVADARDSEAPIFLTRHFEDHRSRIRYNDDLIPNDSTKTLIKNPDLFGMAWMALDNDCNIHFELSLIGMERSDVKLELYLELLPLIAIDAPVSKLHLQDFQGSQVDGFIMNIPIVDLMKLDSGVTFMVLREKQSGKVLLKSIIKELRVPHNCLPYHSLSNIHNGKKDINDTNDNEVPALSFLQIDNTAPQVFQETSACYYEHRFYEEGTQWTSENDPCVMCHCHMGSVKCDATKCPLLDCPKSSIKEPANGFCCPTCTNIKEQDEKRGCSLAGRFYPAGSKWYPYLPPFGFDYCVNCWCDEQFLEIRCKRQVCPPLNCTGKETTRPTNSSCCKTCSDSNLKSVPLVTENRNVQSDDSQWHIWNTPNDLGKTPEEKKIGVERKRVELLGAGGCAVKPYIYANGATWHPKPYVGNSMKCIDCKCKDGKATCSRKRCSKAACNRRLRRSPDITGTYSEPLDECCIQKCNKRNRRHHNMHRPPRRNS